VSKQVSCAAAAGKERGGAEERSFNQADRMRSVRCDVCGAKALVAASTCPKCHHELAVRDPSGDLLPLVYCSTCESHYPARLGTCKWCGTKPERAPIGPYVSKAIAVAAFVALGFVGWLSREERPTKTAEAPPPAVLQSAATTLPESTTASPVTVASAGAIDRDTASITEATSQPPVDTIVPTATPRVAAEALPTAKPLAKPVRKSRPSVRWVNSVSRNWVVVRANPSSGSRIVASIGPNSRVQLGESRGSWRRIRAKRISGWVEHRSFFADAGTGRSNRVGAR
jgi:hypothetical protein